MLEYMTPIGSLPSRILLMATLSVALDGAVGGRVRQALGQSPEASQYERVQRRWVGARTNGLPLWLDFYGDSMVVISDNLYRIPADYALTPDKLVLSGDSLLVRVLATAFNRDRQGEDFGSRSSFEIGYRFSLDRMILEADGVRITMSPQSVLARRLEADWIADLPDGGKMRLRMDRAGNAGYRLSPGGSWVWGQWERNARDILLDWTPDSLEAPDSTLVWRGLYDADGEKIVLENVGEGTGTTIFSRIVR